MAAMTALPLLKAPGNSFAGIGFGKYMLCFKAYQSPARAGGQPEWQPT